jgi:hypothetical protein
MSLASCISCKCSLFSTSCSCFNPLQAVFRNPYFLFSLFPSFHYSRHSKNFNHSRWSKLIRTDKLLLPLWRNILSHHLWNHLFVVLHIFLWKQLLLLRAHTKWKQLYSLKKEVGSCQISSDFLIWRRKSYLEIMI